MNFLNKLYTVESVRRSQEGASYDLRLNPDHIIYRAHFPGEPITPGVCILQMGIELLSDALGEEVELQEAKSVKFLNILRPDGTPVHVDVRIQEESEEGVKAQLVFFTPENPIAKLSILCRNLAKQA